ncbi:ankyrin [Karstenula rhodostoma CBS 690.94]|uniref:Ankyrin n=1 Tax=Karstenula rhodostoma CBS 690.94 TaxID=1392251 RepID=A0A9P4P9S3_9PLEO|nr:ankyrin [Karstenula rhodostoma CBS 690.94]
MCLDTVHRSCRPRATADSTHRFREQTLFFFLFSIHWRQLDRILAASPITVVSASMESIEEAATRLARLGYENKPISEFEVFFAHWKDPQVPSRLRPDASKAFNEGPALRDVVENNRNDLVQMMLPLGFEISDSVMSACLRQTRKTRRTEILDMLFDSGWDINRPVNEYCPPAIRYNLFFWCELNLSVDSCSLLLEHVDLVEHCLARGASPNASSPSGHTVMQRAVAYAPLEITKLLVAHGGTIKGTNVLAHAACAHAQAKATSGSQTPHFEDRRETIHYLLDQGALIDAHYSATMNDKQTGDGVLFGTMTALHFAIAGNQADLVQLLLERGARIDLRGWSAWRTEGQQVNSVELARICGFEDIAVMLED